MEHFPPKVKIAPSGISLGRGGKKQSFVKDTILWGFNWAQSEFVAWPRREIFEKHLKDGSDIRIAPGSSLKMTVSQGHMPLRKWHTSEGQAAPFSPSTPFSFWIFGSVLNLSQGHVGNSFTTEFSVTHQLHSVFFLRWVWSLYDPLQSLPQCYVTFGFK